MQGAKITQVMQVMQVQVPVKVEVEVGVGLCRGACWSTRGRSSLRKPRCIGMRDRLHTRLLLCALALAVCGAPAPAFAYPGEVHQQLSFLAARVFNRCVKNTPIHTLSTLNVRYAARSSNEEASSGFFTRTLRWQYYDRAQEAEPRRWLWLVEPRMQARFLTLERALQSNEGSGEVELEHSYSRLGQIVSHVQDVTVPAIAVPIYYERFWLLSVSDRFNEYPFSLDERDASLDDLCPALLATPDNWTFSTLLAATAEQTLRAVRAGIPELDASWQVFWREPEQLGDFGEYGSAGNHFGEAVEFRCGRPGNRTTCHLLADDPIYREFAEARHRDALLATMRGYLLLQRGASHREQANVNKLR